MAKLYFVKVPNIAAGLRDQNKPRPAWQTKKTKKLFSVSCRCAQTDLYQACPVDRGPPYHFFVGSCFGMRPLAFGLEAPKFRGEMTDTRFFGYKLLIYEPNLTKF